MWLPIVEETPMKVREIMTKDPDCCLPNDSVQKAAKIMKVIDAGIVPVVASGLDQKVIGIVTDRDLCPALSQKAVTQLPRW
jgi:CBS domain-containing protein